MKGRTEHQKLVNQMVGIMKSVMGLQTERVNCKFDPFLPLNVKAEDLSFDLSTFIILALTLLVPLILLPNLIDNAFRTPKDLLILLGIVILVVVWSYQFLDGSKVLKSKSSMPKIMLLLIILNVNSLFYTENYYYTRVAACMNISCLLFFYFVSLHIDCKKALLILVIVAISGVLVSVMTYLQFARHDILFKAAGSGTIVIGTIGNSNSLGAYLMFPLFALAGLVFLLKGKLRLVPACLIVFLLGAFILSRARASWLGSAPALIVFVLLLIRINNFPVWKYFVSHWKKVVICCVVIFSLLCSIWAIAPQRYRQKLTYKSWSDTGSLNFRWKHWQASWHLWLHRNPLFGTGLWSYRNLVYDSQAEINKQDPEYFKDYVNPKPRRVHNDYLEILNDGGLVSAFSLLLFFIIVMKHGYRVIRDGEVLTGERTIVATAFASIIGIMVAAFFFFPFRVNSTLFMTALMMGIMEGIYLRNYKLLSWTEGSSLSFRYFLIPLTILVLICIFWSVGYRPFKGEIEHVQYKRCLANGNGREAEIHILKAIAYDPRNSIYCFDASQLYMNVLRNYVSAEEYIYRATINSNGDLSMWDLYFVKGMMKFHLQSLHEARSAFQKSLYFNPTFVPSHKMLKELERLIKYPKRLSNGRKVQ